MKARTAGVGLVGGCMAVAAAQLSTAAVWTRVSNGSSDWWYLLMFAPFTLAAATVVLMAWLDRRGRRGEWRTWQEQQAAKPAGLDASWQDVEQLWRQPTLAMRAVQPDPWVLREARRHGYPSQAALTGREER